MRVLWSVRVRVYKYLNLRVRVCVQVRMVRVRVFYLTLEIMTSLVDLSIADFLTFTFHKSVKHDSKNTWHAVLKMKKATDIVIV